MILFALLSSTAFATQDTMTRITWGGFVDSYYGYDFNRPASLDRAFTTQPARHDEFKHARCGAPSSAASRRVIRFFRMNPGAAGKEMASWSLPWR